MPDARIPRRSLFGWCLPPAPQEPTVEVIGPYTVAGNFSADLEGEIPPDAQYRADSWGRRAHWTFPLKFYPPPCCEVRILEIHGDLVARQTTLGEDAPDVPGGRFTGVLVAIETLDPTQGSIRADLASDATLVYAQGDIGDSGVVRVPFSVNLRGVLNTVLGPENKLYFKMAKYLDESGRKTHMEITFSNVIYQFERKFPS